jgi:hypothetical protein
VQYVYLVASLPALELAARPRMSSEDLLASSAEVLRQDHWEDLRAVLDDRPADVRAPEFRPYIDAETQLRTVLARLRAARAGATYDPGEHPFAGHDARGVSTAERAMELDDPRERELALDRLRWTLLDELAVSPPFGVQAVLAYGAKLRLAEKWAAMDEAEGLRIAAAVADAALAGIDLDGVEAPAAAAAAPAGGLS